MIRLSVVSCPKCWDKLKGAIVGAGIENDNGVPGDIQDATDAVECDLCGCDQEEEITNAHRAARGRAAIDAYAAAHGVDEANLADLLADLMHAAWPCGWSFDAELERAAGHYREEIQP